MNSYPERTYVPSPLSTAGVGYAFEHKVQAYYLLKLIEGTESRLGKLTRLQFQARYEGVKTDDLICSYERGNTTIRVFVQCKINIGVSESNRDFKSTLLNAWEDYTAALADANFAYRHGTDFLALIYDADTTTLNMKIARRLIQVAKDASDAFDFAKKCTTKQDQEILDIFARVVQPRDTGKPAEVLWDFLRALKWSSFQFEGNTPIHDDEVLNAITRLTGHTESARQLWSALVQEATRLNGNAATVNAGNLANVLDSSVLMPLTAGIPSSVNAIRLVSFPWGAPIWASQHLQRRGPMSGGWSRIGAEDLLLYLRAVRTAGYLAPAMVPQDAHAWAGAIACNLDRLHGSFDDKAALALFVMLNVSNQRVQQELVFWSVRHAAGPFVLATSGVEYTLRGIYFHYYGEDASDSPRLSEHIRSEHARSSRLSTWRSMSSRLLMRCWFFADRSEIPPAPEISVDWFSTMRWSLGDNYPDYRHPEEDTCATPGVVGVVSFQALIRAVRSGCVGEVLSRYRLCTSEPTFERLLNVHAELAAHVRLNIVYISANDVYILREMEKLLGNSVAGEAEDYIDNKLVVLPVQAHFPLLDKEVINQPFTNFSLAPAFENRASDEHAAALEESAWVTQHTDSRRLWGSSTIFADVMLAMTLRTQMFANSRSEATVANMHGIGVSQLSMRAVFHE
ncbi:hypothetical protein CLU93_5536 [Janthinobacterium sp. 35]|uniref:hypothetical protein n=1 Tax=Janthinobacterium sp. 35 TaxID=2035210 RepID=UPI000C189DA3|nr:hypothetical protein [Janthinobacterium sp. 35]PIG25470.1 hypothetical protein CLU93_5536 [Janthinobacterium sp. 35]